MDRALTDEEIIKAYGKEYFETIYKPFSRGEITFNEMQKRQEKHNLKLILPKILKYAKNNKWHKFVDTSLSCPESYGYTFRYFKEVPDKLKYKFAIEAYNHRGDSVPAVRAAVRSLRNLPKQYRPKLPAEITNRETITIYRAGEEDITKCKYRISWTTSKEVALFFLNEYYHKHASHLYRATIRTADIIAYDNDRNEEEILQYGKVYDIEEITEGGRV